MNLNSTRRQASWQRLMCNCQTPTSTCVAGHLHSLSAAGRPRLHRHVQLTARANLSATPSHKFKL